MHLTLKKEATKPAAANFLQQQARFDKFTEVFNNERPHEALDMKYPAEIYQPSSRSYTGLPDIDYPMHDKTIVVTRCGRICLGKKKINFSQVFAGQAVAVAAAIHLAEDVAADRVIYEPRYDDVPERVAAIARPGDLVITMGIGNVYLLCDEIRVACALRLESEART